MKRQENQPGYLPVPLFNQRRRNRIPLTSIPCENEFFSHSEYTASTSSAAPHTASGTYGSNQSLGHSSGAPESHQWSRQGIQQSAPPQQYGGNRPAPGPSPMRTYAPMAHPYKDGAQRSQMGQPGNSVRQQDSRSGVDSRQSSYQGSCGSENTQSKQSSHTGFSQMAQVSSCKPSTSTHQYSQQSRPLPSPDAPSRRPSAHAAQPANKSWKFTNSFVEQKSSFVEKKSLNTPRTAQPTKSQETLPVEPAIENSLRILTAVIDGMRHWSQFKDKVPYLFEIFATLDSAVTLGSYGAKNFLMRDGKHVVQCIFYENEHALPRLIRGQVHRCVGNYDRSRDVLICVSVRPGLPSELRNAQETVKVCDAEMRALVKKLSEV
ncbi:spermatogenesis-associated protein 22 isoform X2 [Melanotaenia boesemani]|nr:spermatogenesis-associated protein 22 isoform X2 [Melanotaenia boesemani]